MKFRLAIVFLLCSLWGFSQNINVRIYSDNKIETFVFYAKSGKYDIVSHNKIICSVNEGESVTINKRGQKININSLYGFFTADTLLLFRGLNQDNKYQVRFHTKKPLAREYDNDLYVKSSTTSLILINDVNFEKYIAGVVESEAGAKSDLEFYKAQAVLCRTYAAKFYKRHLKNNYNLCDGVHCQAYVGRCRYSDAIKQAVEATQGLVLVDKSNVLIEAIFSANSGGETCNSEMVWSKTIPYLRGKPDPYSVGQPGYEWTKTIPRKDWLSYLEKKGIHHSDSCNLSFEQPVRRKYLYVECQDSVLLLTTIRTDWKLRSTFFCIDDRDDVVVLHGKGFGHGVGLSQEGAMEMARLGFPYKEILEFYFTDVHLRNISKLNFFQIE
ncbi:MAG: SpoIID/LytB domain-containing protein [Bacteroidales bacterium]|nr:SpoIID/LytB domain-containing protein [Bacteroidales bacterium]